MATKKDSKLTLTIREASALLGISSNSGYAAAQRGELPVLRFGGRILVSRPALDEMLRGAGKGAVLAD